MPDTPLGDAAVGAAEPNAAAWPNCQWRKVCHGVRLQQDRYCLEHTDERRRHNLLQAVREGAPLDVRGTTISQVLLSRILGALRNDYVPAHDRTLWMTPGEPDFTGGRFTGSACFDHARFSGEARFNGVRFDRPGRWVQNSDVMPRPGSTREPSHRGDPGAERGR